MALNSLAALQTKLSIESATQMNQFLNYSGIYPDAITEYIKIGIIIHIYLDEYYRSELEARTRAKGYFS